MYWRRPGDKSLSKPMIRLTTHIYVTRPHRVNYWLKKKEKMYYQSEIVANKTNNRKVWEIIKQVLNRKKGLKIHDKFMHNNNLITDPKSVADGFNNYFVNIGPTLASKIPENNLSHRQFSPDIIEPSICLNPTNELEIKNVISCLKEGAPGRDGISSKNIKLIKESILVPLTNLFNLSFEQGVFPSEIKLAIITPLYKAKDPMFFNNYRPISLLSVFSKIIERLMYSRLLNFINNHKLFNKLQFGFRNNRSTFMALVILVENLVNVLDNVNAQWVYSYYKLLVKPSSIGYV